MTPLCQRLGAEPSNRRLNAAQQVVDGAPVPAPPAEDTRERRTELVQCIQLLLSGFNDMSHSTIKFIREDPSKTLELLQKGTKISPSWPLKAFRLVHACGCVNTP
jgi:hypothetical protein